MMNEDSGEFFRNKRIVVTGGAGFIGSHLVDALIPEHAKVTVFDMLEPHGLYNLRDSLTEITYHKINMLDREKILELMDGTDIVFHLAGNASVPISVQNPSLDFDANVISTMNVLQALLQKRIGKVVYLSSAAVYGIPKYVPTDEEHPLKPVSPYGATKTAAETIGLTYANAFGVDFVVGRLYSPFGPRQRRYAMFDLLNKIHHDPTHIDVLGNGTQIRDYISIYDTARALLTIAQYGQRGNAYNISANIPVSIRELLPLLIEVSGVKHSINVSYSNHSWVGDLPVMMANTTKLKALGFCPRKSLITGIEELYRWMETEVWSKELISLM